MANYLAPDSSGVPQSTPFLTSSSGAGDAGKPVQTDTNGQLHPTLFGNVSRASTGGTAAESISAGAHVYFASDGVRNADASDTAKAATHYVEAAYSVGATVTAYSEGVQTGLTGLTTNASYFLSGSTPGAATTTPPTTSGHIVQFLGKAKSTTERTFQPAIRYKN